MISSEVKMKEIKIKAALRIQIQLGLCFLIKNSVFPEELQGSYRACNPHGGLRRKI
jgi:hypothetical protein